MRSAPGTCGWRPGWRSRTGAGASRSTRPSLGRVRTRPGTGRGRRGSGRRPRSRGRRAGRRQERQPGPATKSRTVPSRQPTPPAAASVAEPSRNAARAELWTARPGSTGAAARRHRHRASHRRAPPRHGHRPPRGRCSPSSASRCPAPARARRAAGPGLARIPGTSPGRASPRAGPAGSTCPPRSPRPRRTRSRAAGPRRGGWCCAPVTCVRPATRGGSPTWSCSWWMPAARWPPARGWARSRARCCPCCSTPISAGTRSACSPSGAAGPRSSCRPPSRSRPPRPGWPRCRPAAAPRSRPACSARTRSFAPNVSATRAAARCSSWSPTDGPPAGPTRPGTRTGPPPCWPRPHVHSVVVDCESGPVRLGLAAALPRPGP